LRWHPEAPVPREQNFRQRGVGLGEFIQGVTNLCQFQVIGGILDFQPRRRDEEVTTAPLSATAGCVIDDDSTHHPCGITHELPAISEGVPLFACPRQFPPGEAMQFGTRIFVQAGWARTAANCTELVDRGHRVGRRINIGRWVRKRSDWCLQDSR
jgi:hypothetical protein